MMSYTVAARKAIDYLLPRLLDDAWVARHDDVAYYFKAPLALLEAGDPAAAGRALDVAARYAERGGGGSANGAYAEFYPHYPWMWMCWSAVLLGRMPLAESCYEKMRRFAVPSICAGLVREPFRGTGQACEADLFATAELVKVALLLGRRRDAAAAGEVLRRALRANREPMISGYFFLRWRGETSDQEPPVLIRQEGVFNCVAQGMPGQLYFMLAFPVMVLLELASLHDEPTADDCRAAANEMLAYLKGCAGVYSSPMAHKVCIAAAMAGDAETARKIADFLVSLQDSGCFQEDAEAMDSVDQTAEIAAWLFQVEKSLALAAVK